MGWIPAIVLLAQVGAATQDDAAATVRRDDGRVVARPAALPWSDAPAQERRASAANAWLDRLTFNVYGNVFASKDSKRFVDDEGNEIDDRVRVRAVDLELLAPLHEVFAAVVVASIESDPVNEHEVDLESAYLRLHDLPYFEGTNWDFAAQVGRFRPAFGQGNLLRITELPQITRPPALAHFLGFDGYQQTGVSGEIAFRPRGTGHELRLFVQGLDAGDLPITETSGDEAFSELGHLAWNWRISEEHELASGVSALRSKQTGDSARRSLLYGADVLYTRNPADDPGYGTFFLGGELFQADIEREAGADDRPLGWYVWTEYRFHPSWAGGLRFDTFEDLEDDALETSAWGVFVSYLFSDLVRFAVGWQQFESDLSTLDGGKSLLAEVNFAFGKAPARPFWAAR